jgi:predicted MFS family arabinose efflux permease
LVTIVDLKLSQEYGLDELKIGLCYLPFGLGAMVGSIVGGRVTDKLTHKYKCTEGGLLASIIGIIAMQPGVLVTTILNFSHI